MDQAPAKVCTQRGIHQGLFLLYFISDFVSTVIGGCLHARHFRSLQPSSKWQVNDTEQAGGQETTALLQHTSEIREGGPPLPSFCALLLDIFVSFLFSSTHRGSTADSAAHVQAKVRVQYAFICEFVCSEATRDLMLSVVL